MAKKRAKATKVTKRKSSRAKTAFSLDDLEQLDRLDGPSAMSETFMGMKIADFRGSLKDAAGRAWVYEEIRE
jgi:hypothetical protein